MAHQKGPYKKLKTRKRLEREQKVLEILGKHNEHEKKNPKPKTKRKTPGEMLELLPPGFGGWLDFKIRDPQNWISKSYNINRQTVDFAKWLYCEYDVPPFMFEIFVPKYVKLSRIRRVIAPSSTYDKKNFKEFMSWVITIGQGYSFAKTVKSIFTKKEAHLFLNAPNTNSIVENIWWARCKAREIPDNITLFIVQRFPHMSYNSPFWISFLNFIKNNEDELNIDTLQELVDFIPAHRRRVENFSLKGRTLNSLIQLSNEWHRVQQVTKHDKYQQWDGINVENWSYTNKSEKITWNIRQLRNSKELYNEGRRMRHCVYGYVDSCVRGTSGIFTMKSTDQYDIDEAHLTIEVTNGGRLVQVRGRLNRKPSAREYNALYKWALERHLTIDNWVSRR